MSALSSWAKLSMLCAKQQPLWGDPEALSTRLLRDSPKAQTLWLMKSQPGTLPRTALPVAKATELEAGKL